MLAREQFSISEVVSRTGVPAASIHHYLRLGLLPAPRRVAPNRFLYDQRHVQALRLIRTLRDQRKLSLREIRPIVPKLMGLDREEAFRPEMWDRVAGIQLARASRRSPSARLLAAAVDAFSRRGFDDVNVDEICRAAGLAKGSFYRHYRSKEELYFAAAEAAALEVAESFRSAADGPGEAHHPTSDLLAGALQPRLPLFVDLLTRALQRRPGYGPMARRIFNTLAYQIGEHLGSADPLATGVRLLIPAAAGILRDTFQPSPLAELDPARVLGTPS